MNSRDYPQGYSIGSDDTETTPTAADLIATFSSEETKYISLTNLFASPPAIGSVTPAAGDFTELGADKLLFGAANYTASGAIDPDVSFVTITSATPATVIALTIAAPAAGRFLVITQLDEGTAGNTVTLTAGTYDGSATVATFNAQNESLVLFGISATRFLVVENIGSVGLA